MRGRLLEPVFQASGGKFRLSRRVAGMGAERVAAGGETGERAGAQASRLCPNLRGVEWVLVTHLCEHGGEHSGATARSSPGSMPCHLQLSSVHGLKRKKVLEEQPEGCMAHQLPHLCSLIRAQSPGKTGDHLSQWHSPGARALVMQSGSSNTTRRGSGT